MTRNAGITGTVRIVKKAENIRRRGGNLREINMNKETRKKLENAFYEYKKNRNISICETLNCIASKHLTTNYDKIPVKSSGINCAEDSIIRLLDANTERYKWCKVVEMTLERFYGEHKDRLIKAHYFEHKSINTVSRELHISRRTFFYWLDEILLKAEFWAREYRLIR